MDNHLYSVLEILLDPLCLPTSESGFHGLIQFSSKFGLIDGKLMHQNLQGCHMVVIPK